MSLTLCLFPSPLDTPVTVTHDTGGWTLTTSMGTRPSDGAACQVLTIPDSTPDGNGAWYTIPGKKGPTGYHGVLYLHLPTGPGMVIDIFPPVSAGASLPRLSVAGQFLVQE